MGDDQQQLLGWRISRYRKASGLNQERLAEKLSVALETISRMERGVTAPSIKTLGRIADVLGVSVQDFFIPDSGTSEKERALENLVTLLEAETAPRDSDGAGFDRYAVRTAGPALRTKTSPEAKG